MSLLGKSLYILTPMYGGVLTVNYHHSFFKLVHTFNELRWQMREQGIPEKDWPELSSHNVYNESLISRARNRLLDCYLKETSFTHACFIDADIGFEAEDILSMLELDKPILGVPCSKKSIRWDRVQVAIARRVLEWAKNVPPNGLDSAALALRFRESGSLLNQEDISRVGGDFVFNALDDWNGNMDLGTPEPMKHVGSGILMVKREVFMKFMKAYPDRWYTSKDEASNPGRIHDFFKTGVNLESREYLSEDYWFIRDCRAIGYQALLCPWVKSTHMGTFTFVGDMPAAYGSVGSIL